MPYICPECGCEWESLKDGPPPDIFKQKLCPDCEQELRDLEILPPKKLPR